MRSTGRLLVLLGNLSRPGTSSHPLYKVGTTYRADRCAVLLLRQDKRDLRLAKLRSFHLPRQHLTLNPKLEFSSSKRSTKWGADHGDPSLSVLSENLWEISSLCSPVKAGAQLLASVWTSASAE